MAGQAAYVVWMISMCMGFSQSFTYAEMAGMFGNKSGGTSVYGATAWLRYSKMIAPLSVWCNWFAWSPVLSLGCAIAAGYILNALFPIPLAESQAVVDWVAANGAQFTATSQPVVDYIAANAGVSEVDAISAVASAAGVDALTPAFRVWEAFSIAIPGSGHAALQLDLRDWHGPDADHVRDPASWHRLDRKCAEMAWRSSCWCRCSLWGSCRS